MSRRKNINMRRRHEDHSVDDWLMTYADMITLLLCFFAVFLSVSVPKKDIFDQAREKVLQQFAAQNTLSGMFPTPPGNAQSGGVFNALPSVVDQYHSGEGRSTGSGTDAGEGHSDGMGEGPKQGTSSTANPFENIGPGKVKDDGDRITTIDIPSATAFASGSATLSDEGKAVLQGIIDNQLKTAKLQDYQITVEGHTDDVPISTAQFPSNWELSTARAAAVVRFFIEHGVLPERLRAAGYADIFPKVPNRDKDGNALPDNQAQNRRVVIKLEKIQKAK